MKNFLVLFFVFFLFSSVGCSGVETQPEATPLQIAEAEAEKAEAAYETFKAEAKAKKLEAEKAAIQLGQAELDLELAKYAVAGEAKKEEEALKKGLASLESPKAAPQFLDLKFNSFTPKGVEALTQVPFGWKFKFDHDKSQFVLYVDGKETVRFSEPTGASYPEYWRLSPFAKEGKQIQFLPQ